MPITRPSFRFVKFTLTLLLILSFLLYTIASDPVAEESIDLNNDDDLKGFEELLAIDEAEEEEEAAAVQDHEGSKTKPSEADVVSKAQRIVIELSSDNTKRIIDDNEYVLVLGYAPWCVRSAEMMPQFAEAATVLKEMGSPLLLAKLDAERHPKAASFLGIKGFPTLLLFVNGSSQAYTGGFSAEELVIWARKKTGAPVIRLSSVAEAEEFIAKHRIFVIGLFEKYEGTDYEEFRKAAVDDNEIQFAETQNIEVAKVLFPDLKKQNPFLGIVKSEPEKYAAFEEAFEKDKILKFLDYNKFPLVTVLTELKSVRVYSSPVKLQVFVFAEVNEFKSMLSTLQNVAAKFKSKIMFIYVDITVDNLAKPFLTLLGLEDSDKTVVAAFDNKISSKYLLEFDATLGNLEEFCSGLLQGTVSPYFKSQPIPDNNLSNGTSVQTVVGRSFDDLVLNSPHNVLLEVHTPWCIKCEATTKQVEKLAKHFKGLDNLVFARIDASANEHPKLQVEDFPSLLFYPANDKLNPIKLSTKSSLKELASVIKKNVRVADDRGSQDQTNRDEL